MPYARCPICNVTFHLSITSDLREWEREHVRERAADGVPLLECIRCWVELKPGHRVTLRSLPAERLGSLAAGQEGVVECGPTGESGEIAVRFGDAVARFKREELFYVVGQAPVA
jgi:hypothetical protein